MNPNELNTPNVGIDSDRDPDGNVQTESSSASPTATHSTSDIPVAQSAEPDTAIGDLTTINVSSEHLVAHPNSGATDSAMDQLVDLEAVDVSASGDVQIVDQTDGLVQASEVRPSEMQVSAIWEVLKVVLIPLLILSACAGGIGMLGVAQRFGWINSGSGDGELSLAESDSDQASATSYICPMMCVPPTTKPGRCPVCAMELVPATTSSSSGPSSHIQIDPRSRRVSGIQTVVAKSQTLFREVRGVGEITYDESKLKTLSAYIDGRIEELVADYTGIEVKKGESLALLYSPELYGAQVEYARTLEFVEESNTSNSKVVDSNRRLLASSRARLAELGMTEAQILALEKDKVANRRLALHAPMSGTVIEKMAVTGQYIKAGEPIYRLADLSSVWLVLELFSEDASLIEIGQSVTAITQSMNGQECEGKVEFVEPTVDPKMRTVGVRVAIDNEHGHLKPGEFVRATLRIPLLSKDGEAQETIVVPRNSLLSVGQTSLVYVEGKPGEFELRHVKTGPTVDGLIAILEGVKAGENVVAKSTFLLDAQMQLQGNPSLIDPDKAVAELAKKEELTDAELEEIRNAMEQLSEEDRTLAIAQRICPVTEVRLGSMGMGTPIKLEVDGSLIFVCCEACRDKMLTEPDKYVKILADYAAGKTSIKNDSANDGMPQMELPEMDLPQMELPQTKLPGE